MTSLDTSRTSHPDVHGIESAATDAASRAAPPQDFVVKREPEREPEREARASPDPMRATDRYRLMMPYVERL